VPRMLDLFALGFGGQELWIILAVIIILFGGKKIPELMRGVGRGVGELQKGVEEGKKSMQKSIEEGRQAPDEPEDKDKTA
jgi:sec-independent protein translocase protein TatA